MVMENSSSTKKMRSTEVDRISGLPDSLLVHIISFLPADDAFATRLLSKRWKPLWHSLTTLHFKTTRFRNVSSFVKFMDNMFDLVDLKSVKKFVIEFCRYKPPRKISKWINNAVINSKVEHLEVRMWCERDLYVLPCSIFFAKNIKVLKLSRVCLGNLSHADLPLLETLHLQSVEFSDLTSLEILLNACVLLKDLDVTDFEVDGVNLRPLKIGRLNHLVTAKLYPQSFIPVEALSNVKCLQLSQPSDKDIWPFNHDTPVFHNLTHLECGFEEWTKMVNCLEKFPKLQKLVLKEWQCGFSCHPEPIYEVPSCISYHLKEFTLDYRSSESQSELIKFIVKNARVLRTINLDTDSSKFKHPRIKKLDACIISAFESEHKEPLVFMV